MIIIKNNLINLKFRSASWTFWILRWQSGENNDGERTHRCIIMRITNNHLASRRLKLENGILKIISHRIIQMLFLLFFVSFSHSSVKMSNNFLYHFELSVTSLKAHLVPCNCSFSLVQAQECIITDVYISTKSIHAEQGHIFHLRDSGTAKQTWRGINFDS